MKNPRISLAAPLLALLAGAASGATPSPAPKTLPKEIILYVYGGADPKFEYSSRVNAAVDRTPNLIHMKVADGAEFARRLQEIRGAGSKIVKLVIDAHGAPGLTEALDSGDLPRFKGLDAVFAPNTDIIFHSCSVAENEDGKRFMREVGATLLTKGGSVTAATGTFYFYGDKLSRAILPDVEGFSPKGWLKYSARAGGGGSFQYIPVGIEEIGEKGDARLRQAEALAQIRAKVETRLAEGGVAWGAKAASAQVNAQTWLASKGVGGAEALAKAQLEAQHVVARTGAKLLAPSLVPAVDLAHRQTSRNLSAGAGMIQDGLSQGAALTRRAISTVEARARQRLEEMQRLKEAAIKKASAAARAAWTSTVEMGAAGVNAAGDAAQWGVSKLKKAWSWVYP